MTTASLPRRDGSVAWLRRNLLRSPMDAAVTLILLAAALYFLPRLFRWAVIDAVWQAPDMASCRTQGDGACWAFLAAKFRYILFGRYPFESQWRPALALLLFGLALGVSLWRGISRQVLAGVWIGVPVVSLILMRGGLLGLDIVTSDLWGGLPATLMLALASSILALPLAILFALACRSRQPAIRLPAAGFVAVVRGVPLLTILFMTSLVLPFFLPPGLTLERFPAALLGLTAFLTAYLTADVGAGLAALPPGQAEAGASLGLSRRQNLRLVILPQALALVIQPIVGNLIGNVKNTALVSVVGLFDLTLTTRTALLDPQWRGATVEADLFLAGIYMVLCGGLQLWGRALERRLTIEGSR